MVAFGELEKDVALGVCNLAPGFTARQAHLRLDFSPHVSPGRGAHVQDRACTTMEGCPGVKRKSLERASEGCSGKLSNNVIKLKIKSDIYLALKNRWKERKGKISIPPKETTVEAFLKILRKKCMNVLACTHTLYIHI